MPWLQWMKLRRTLLKSASFLLVHENSRELFNIFFFNQNRHRMAPNGLQTRPNTNVLNWMYCWIAKDRFNCENRYLLQFSIHSLRQQWYVISLSPATPKTCLQLAPRHVPNRPQYSPPKAQSKQCPFAQSQSICFWNFLRRILRRSCTWKGDLAFCKFRLRYLLCPLALGDFV